MEYKKNVNDSNVHMKWSVLGRPDLVELSYVLRLDISYKTLMSSDKLAMIILWEKACTVDSNSLPTRACFEVCQSWKDCIVPVQMWQQ